jgi:hypothetical protein
VGRWEEGGGRRGGAGSGEGRRRGGGPRALIVIFVYRVGSGRVKLPRNAQGALQDACRSELGFSTGMHTAVTMNARARLAMYFYLALCPAQSLGSLLLVFGARDAASCFALNPPRAPTPQCCHTPHYFPCPCLEFPATLELENKRLRDEMDSLGRKLQAAQAGERAGGSRYGTAVVPCGIPCERRLADGNENRWRRVVG